MVSPPLVGSICLRTGRCFPRANTIGRVLFLRGLCRLHPVVRSPLGSLVRLVCWQHSGVLPMVPWLIAAIDFAQNAYGRGQYNLLFVLLGISKSIYLFIRHWLSMSLGLDLRYSLGNNFVAFLEYPTIGHTRVYVGVALFGVVILIFLTILVRLALRMYAQPRPTVELIFCPRSATALALNAAFWGYGLLLTATLQPLYLHYLNVAFSLPALWLTWLARVGSSGSIRSVANSRLLLSGLVLAQACITITFLSYIHETQFIKGDYGTVYRAQTHILK